jgi:hypothetical protein
MQQEKSLLEQARQLAKEAQVMLACRELHWHKELGCQPGPKVQQSVVLCYSVTDSSLGGCRTRILQLFNTNICAWSYVSGPPPLRDI